jgi:hypothetical protein
MSSVLAVYSCAQSAAYCVVVLAPLLDDNLRFFQTAEDFTVQQLIA